MTSNTIEWSRIAALVADGVGVTRGDKVSVFVTDSSAMDAVAGFVDECWRRGAVPQVVSTDERFDESALRWADSSVLEQAPPLEVAAMEWSDVHVSFRAMTSPVVDADPARIAAHRRGRGIVSTLRWQNTRWALVRVPTPTWAAETGLDYGRLLAEWAASFDADWSEAAERMGALCDRLARTRTVVIEDEWGRLELPVAGRRWVAFSGEANWPDGEIATAPVEHGVSGTIRFPGVFYFAGVRVRDLELTFENGQVVREAASEGLELVTRLLDTDAGARRVGELGIGTNAALATPTGDLLIDEKILGTVHIALGRAYPQCGGVNESALHWDIVKDLRPTAGSGSLAVDGEWLIRDGVVQQALADASVAGLWTPEALHSPGRDRPTTDHEERDMYANELDTPAPLTQHPLRWRETATPAPGPGQILIEVVGCGVCRSNLHMIEGDWVAAGVPAISPIVPGHEVTGRIAALGDGVTGFSVGDPVGVQPLWWTCEECEFCTSDREHLCHRRLITGEHVDGGYGEFMLATAAHTYRVPENLDLADAAPLFCPGITGYGAVKKLDVGPGQRVGVFGLGGVGHLALQFALLTGAEVVAVARGADHLAVARELGAHETVDASAVDPGEALEDSLDAAVTFAPSDAVTAQALRALKWGGTLVSGVPVSVEGFPFNKEQVIKASILGSRRDMEEVLRLASEGKVRTVVDRFEMSRAEEALTLLAQGRLRSRAVLVNG